MSIAIISMAVASIDSKLKLIIRLQVWVPLSAYSYLKAKLE